MGTIDLPNEILDQVTLRLDPGYSLEDWIIVAIIKRLEVLQSQTDDRAYFQGTELNAAMIIEYIGLHPEYFWQGNSKINRIKAVRVLTGLGLAGAKDLVEEIFRERKQ